MINGRKIAARLHEGANESVRRHIMPYLREDSVVRSFWYDELLMLFANKQFEKKDKLSLKKYVRFLICGKNGTTSARNSSPALFERLTSYSKNMALMPKYRENPHVFGVNSRNIDRDKHLLACNLMRKFSERCGAGDPHTFRGTELREQMATECIALNLSENQVSGITNSMGHHEKIHKEIYR